MMIIITIFTWNSQHVRETCIVPSPQQQNLLRVRYQQPNIVHHSRTTSNASATVASPYFACAFGLLEAYLTSSSSRESTARSQPYIRLRNR